MDLNTMILLQEERLEDMQRTLKGLRKRQRQHIGRFGKPDVDLFNIRQWEKDIRYEKELLARLQREREYLKNQASVTRYKQIRRQTATVRVREKNHVKTG